MSKKVWMIVISVVLIVVTAANTLFFIRDNFFYKLSDVPKGTLAEGYTRPVSLDDKTDALGDYTFNFYNVDCGDGYFGVRGELSDNSSNSKAKTVFWETGATSADIMPQFNKDSGKLEFTKKGDDKPFVELSVAKGETYDSRTAFDPIFQLID